MPVCPRVSRGSRVPGGASTTISRPPRGQAGGCRDPAGSATAERPSLTSNRSPVGWDVTGSAAVRTIACKNENRMKAAK